MLVLAKITISDVHKHRKFLHWLIQFAENNKWHLNFRIGGINTFLLVIDLKSVTWYRTLATKRPLHKVNYKFR